MPKTPSKSRRTNKKAAPAKKRTSWLGKIRMRGFGNPLTFVVAFVFVGAITLVWASAATTTYGLWDDKAIPKIIAADDRHNIELGTKFRSSASGYVTGVRFYKSAQNTGVHTGSLWTERGRLLATVTFSKETASGWQSATFDKPVSVAANVTYVVSYHAPKGRYSVDFKYFNGANHQHNKLTAPRANRSNPNGVYRYGNQTIFPRENGSGANYWVDVTFTNKLINAPVAPAAPGNLVANLQGEKSVALRWQASVSENQISSYEVFRGGDKIATTANTTYTDTGVTAGKSYEYSVKAVDVNGTVSAASTKVTIAIPAPSTGGGTGTGGSTGGSTGGNTGGSGSGSGTGGTGGGNSNGGSTGGPSTGSTANLFNASKKEIAMQLVSSAENSSLDWRAQYAYIEDIGDGRGYTAGIIGFCSGTGDMLEMVQYYNKIAPGNILAKYIPALQKVNGTESHSGLGTAFQNDWKTAAKDPKFQQAQDYERDQVYFNPAVNQAITDGLHSLGQFAYYDAMVMHGPGSDPVSFGGIRATAMKKAKTPAQGGNETTYLNAFLDARAAAMLTEAAHEDVDRVETEQRVFLKAGNLNLDPPLSWTVYGDAYSITKNP